MTADEKIEMYKRFSERVKACDPYANPADAAELLRLTGKLVDGLINKGRSGYTDKLAEQIAALTEQIALLSAALTVPQKKNPQKSRKKNVPKKKYGEYKHVFLTDEEYERLIKDFGEGTVKQYIQAVDEYVQQHGKTYDDYNLTLRKWIRGDRKDGESEENQHSYDLNKYIEHAMNNTPTLRSS